MANLLLALSATVFAVGAIEGLARVLTEWGVLRAYNAMQTMVPAGTEDWRMAHITADKYREPGAVLAAGRARAVFLDIRFKGPEVAERKPPGTFRILCYGDSNTDGPVRGGWPERLQQVLDRDRAVKGPKYEVLNAGVAGYTSHQGLLRFRSEVARFDPDLAPVSFGLAVILAPAIGKPDKEFEIPSPLLVAAQRALLRFRFYRVALHYLRSGVTRCCATRAGRPTRRDRRLCEQRPGVCEYRPRPRCEDRVVDVGRTATRASGARRDGPELAVLGSGVQPRPAELRQRQRRSGARRAGRVRGFPGSGLPTNATSRKGGHAAMAEWLAAALRSAALLPWPVAS